MTDLKTIGNLGFAAYNLRYQDFLVALDLVDDAYARDKYADLKTLGRAMTPFSNAALASIIDAYLKIGA
jgi:hypothetical protein